MPQFICTHAIECMHRQWQTTTENEFSFGVLCTPFANVSESMSLTYLERNKNEKQILAKSINLHSINLWFFVKKGAQAHAPFFIRWIIQYANCCCWIEIPSNVIQTDECLKCRRMPTSSIWFMCRSCVTQMMNASAFHITLSLSPKLSKW